MKLQKKLYVNEVFSGNGLMRVELSDGTEREYVVDIDNRMLQLIVDKLDAARERVVLNRAMRR